MTLDEVCKLLSARYQALNNSDVKLNQNGNGNGNENEHEKRANQSLVFNERRKKPLDEVEKKKLYNAANKYNLRSKQKSSD